MQPGQAVMLEETLKANETVNDAPGDNVAKFPLPFTDTPENVNVLPSREISTGSAGA